MTYKLSPSSLNLFVECPRCFWLHVVKKIKRPDGAFPSLPGGMDRILKAHFDRFMERGELPPELRHLDCAKDCSLFNDKEKLKIWRSNMKGIQYIDPESGVILRGAVDNLLVKNGKFIVLDYKTRGSEVKEDTHEHYQLQMDLYNFLLRKNGYETEDFTFLLFYYPSHVTETGEVIFYTHLKEITTNPKQGEKVFQAAIRVLTQERPPSPEPDCGFCQWNSKNLIGK